MSDDMNKIPQAPESPAPSEEQKTPEPIVTSQFTQNTQTDRRAYAEQLAVTRELNSASGENMTPPTRIIETAPTVKTLEPAPSNTTPAYSEPTFSPADNSRTQTNQAQAGQSQAGQAQAGQAQAGQAQANQAQANQAQTNQDQSGQAQAYKYASYYSAPMPPKTEAKKAKVRPSIAFTAITCAICLLLGAVSGLGASLIYNHFLNDGHKGGTGTSDSASTTDPSGGNVVLNQSTNEPSLDVDEGSLTAVIDDISKTVVEIRTEKVSYGYFIGNYVSEGAGSGVIINENGYIITNNHVIEGADNLTVRTKSGEEYEATLIGTDTQTDIAVIKIEATGLPTATLGTSNDLKVGQRAIAIGNPLGELGGTVTIGYISALDREVDIDGISMTLLQTDAAINPGNSGGGLFDVDGRLIGVVNAKSTGSDIEGLGFAIPIDTAKEIATDLIENGHVSGRPALGVQIQEVTSSNLSTIRGTELYSYVHGYGVYVVKDDRGNFQFGDMIVAFNDTIISTQADLTNALYECEIGETVTVTVSRSRKRVEIQVELTELNS